MSVDGKENWLENRAIELFEEIQRKNPHLSYKEIDELCYKQAEKDYMNQPEVDYKKIQEESEEDNTVTISSEEYDRLNSFWNEHNS
tara:strand:+ start:395 stop:652 length:258 start_codon:yes stop_codon:yes gene_type:complete